MGSPSKTPSSLRSKKSVDRYRRARMSSSGSSALLSSTASIREPSSKNSKEETHNMAKDKTRDSNPDPITGEPGAHPVGVAGGGTGGALAGAAIGGAVGGPVGAAVGGAIGAVAGGLGGKAAAEAVNPTQEDAYWRSNYASRPYVKEVC